MNEPHPATPRLKRALALAQREASVLGHKYVGCEHLVLAILRIGEGTGSKILIESGLTIEKVKKKILEEVGSPLSNLILSMEERVHALETQIKELQSK